MSNFNIRIRVAALLIENGKILFIAHKKDNAVYWLLPGGGVKSGESLEEALKRELKEELNISIKVKDVALICDSIAPDDSKHIVNICFFCSHNTGKYFLSKEQRLYDFGFFDVDALMKHLQILPPIKNELENMLSGFDNNIYQRKEMGKSIKTVTVSTRNKTYKIIIGNSVLSQLNKIDQIIEDRQDCFSRKFQGNGIT